MLHFKDLVKRDLRQLEFGDAWKACALDGQRCLALLHEGALVLDSDLSEATSPKQCGPVVRALALRSRDPGFKTGSDHSLKLFLVAVSDQFNFPAALVNSQLVCLRPVGILKSCCCCSVPSFR